MTPQEQNFVTRLMQIAEELIDIQVSIQQHAAQWFAGLNSSITNGELSAIPSFEHISDTELGNAITAILAVDTALGNYSSGQVGNLLALRG